jgi:glycosyltransferase involved in cell wall biosynthesis
MGENMKFLKENLLQYRNAGTKARCDMEKIFQNRYTTLISIDQLQFSNFYSKFEFLSKKKTIETVIFLIKRHNENVILQYPFYFNRLYKYVLYHFVTKNHCVLFVHDIDTLRGNKKISLKKEINILNHSTAIILHNSKMISYLQQHGLTTNCINLELFDYLLPGDIPKQQYSLGNEIVFAGNLAKSEFIESIPHKKIHLQFNLFGNGLSYKAKNNPNIFYQGSFSPEEIPYKLHGSFGLVWDGNSLDTCSGDVGEYLKLNNPHKLSLYIAAGLPVIVWKQAAIAQIVDEYNIGFCVDSIQDISSKINSLNVTDYSKYLENIKKLQKLVITGYFTNRALDQVEKIMGENLLHKES